MSLLNSFKVSGTGLLAQSARLNTTASNLANSETAASSEAGVYQTRKVIFEAELDGAFGARAKAAIGVNAKEVVLIDDPAKKIFA